MNIEFNHFKKGVQYSHYTGAYRQNILDYSVLLSESLEADFYLKLKGSINYLESSVKQLDKINNLNVFSQIEDYINLMSINLFEINSDKCKLIIDILQQINKIISYNDFKNKLI